MKDSIKILFMILMIITTDIVSYSEGYKKCKNNYPKPIDSLPHSYLLRSYQFYLNDSSIIIYDADRIVGEVIISNTSLDTLMMKDNE